MITPWVVLFRLIIGIPCVVCILCAWHLVESDRWQWWIFLVMACLMTVGGMNLSTTISKQQEKKND